MPNQALLNEILMFPSNQVADGKFEVDPAACGNCCGSGCGGGCGCDGGV